MSERAEMLTWVIDRIEEVAEGYRTKGLGGAHMPRECDLLVRQCEWFAEEFRSTLKLLPAIPEGDHNGK
jgi:GTP-dependent phosphoenolpyruvate carboxykinase